MKFGGIQGDVTRNVWEDRYYDWPSNMSEFNGIYWDGEENFTETYTDACKVRKNSVVTWEIVGKTHSHGVVCNGI